MWELRKSQRYYFFKFKRFNNFIEAKQNTWNSKFYHLILLTNLRVVIPSHELLQRGYSITAVRKHVCDYFSVWARFRENENHPSLIWHGRKTKPTNFQVNWLNSF